MSSKLSDLEARTLHQLRHLIACAALASAFVANPSPQAAAQVDAPCPILTDAALSEVLGMPAHAQSAFSTPPVVACVLAANGVEILLTREPITSDTAALIPGRGGAAGGGEPGANAFGVTITQLGDLGDSALLTSDPSDQQNPSAMLWVVSGPDAYAFTSWGLHDPQATLPAVARAVISKA